MKNQIELSDFTKEVNSSGYQILYKGNKIGGAGILGRNTGRSAARAKDRQMYSESADRDIQGLIKGYGRPDQLALIEQINNQ